MSGLTANTRPEQIFIDSTLKYVQDMHSGQTRKYTGEPYWYHLWNVAKMVQVVTGGDAEMMAAALLHDVVEDTSATFEDLRNRGFSKRTIDIVRSVTDVSKPEDGNRAERKALDRMNVAKGHPDAKTVKLADLIDNSVNIVYYDPKFAKVYMEEKRLLMEVLEEGNKNLYKVASDILDEYQFDPSSW